MKKTIAGICIVMLAGLVISCGYHFSAGGENIDRSIRLVYIDNLANNTSEANAENIFRNALSSRFQSTTRFRLAGSRDEADAILKGRIVALSKSHLSYTTSDIAQEDRVTATLDLTFETKDEGIIWSNHAFSWYGDYLIGSQDNPALADANRKAALQKLADDVADRVFRAIMSGF